MAHAPVIVAHGDKEAVEFGRKLFGEGAHILNKLLGFRAGLIAKPLVCNGHELFGVDIVYQANGRVLRGLAAVVIALAVVALRQYIWMRMNVAA